VGLFLRDAPDLPSGSAIVAIDHVRVASGRAGVVVAGDDETSATELDAVAWARCVPGPAGALDLGGDFGRRAPGSAVVCAASDPDSSVLFRGLRLRHLPGVAGEKEKDRSGLALDHGGWVADGVAAHVGDNLHGLPRLAVIEAAAEKEVDIAGVGCRVAAAL